MTPNIPAEAASRCRWAPRIGAAAQRLDELRQNWLNPPELINRTPEIVPGYPDKIAPKHAAAAAELSRRTLTNLYNTNPTWLKHAHRDLDEAVAAAYGWEWPLEDEEILKRLLELNLQRSAVKN
jgi:type II restriction/modification system DNA methylase subunit YeeA